MELWQGRDLEPADSQRQRWRFGLYRQAKSRLGQGRPSIQGKHRAEQRLLGRPTRNERPSVCRCHRRVPLRPRSLDREGQAEMGPAHRHPALHPAQLGQELHGIHQLLPGLYSWLRQV